MQISARQALSFSMIAAVLLLLINTVVAYVNARTVWENNRTFVQEYELVAVIDETMALMQDAETGQRGFLITGDEQYLAPYNNAIVQVTRRLDRLRRDTRNNPAQQQALQQLDPHIIAKFDELEQTIQLRREQGFSAAQSIVLTNTGKGYMDQIRSILSTMRATQLADLQQRSAVSIRNLRQVTITFALATLLDLVLLGGIYALTTRDLLKRERSEAARREAEARAHALLYGMTDAVFLKDPDGRYLVCNPATAMVLGASDVDEVVGKTDLDLLPQSTALNIRAFDQQVLATRQALQFEEQIRPGQTLLTLRSPYYDGNGTLQGVIGIARDISERKRVENERIQLLKQEQAARETAENVQRHFEIIAEASRLFVATALNVSEVLEALAQMLARQIGDMCVVWLITPDGESLVPQVVHHVDPETGARMQHILGHDVRHVGEEAIGRVAQTGQSLLVPHITHEQWMGAINPKYRPYAQHVNVHSMIAVALKTKGRVIGTLGLLRDVTAQPYAPDNLTLAQELADRAALAIENARLYEEAQEAIRVREVFLSIAAHELKTPLTSLLGYSFVLQRRIQADPSMPERERRMINAITEQGYRLNRLIDTLLNLSRIQLGRLSIEKQPLELVALVRRTVEEFQPTLEKHTLHLETVPSALVLGDELRLEQVLHNLLQNAAKYSPEGGSIVVQVTTRDDQAVIAVKDQGIGIPQSARPNLFRQFYRAGNVDPKKISGLGVGLFVVHEIVALHGGAITVESVEQQGSTFFVQIPLANPST